MTEAIRSRRTAAEVTNAVPVTTGSARTGAEREDKMLMISWAALLEEAVTKPGHIHEAYSRCWGYSIGNQILAYCQCLQSYVEYACQPPGSDLLGRTMREASCMALAEVLQKPETRQKPLPCP